MIDLLHAAARLALAAPHFFLELRASTLLCVALVAAFAQRHRDRCRQRGKQEVGDLAGRTHVAPLPFRDEGVGRAIQRRRPILVDRAERTQELDARAEVGPHGIEDAHDREVLRERRAPLRNVVAGRDQIDQCHARPPGPAQHFHLGFVLPPVRPAAVDDIQNAGALDDGFQELALVLKARIVLVRLRELRDHGCALAGAAVVRLEPRERLARALKTRRVDELVEHLAVEPHRIGTRVRRRSGVRRDRDRVILGERRDDAALAFVGMADDREARPGHAVPVST